MMSSTKRKPPSDAEKLYPLSIIREETEESQAQLRSGLISGDGKKARVVGEYGHIVVAVTASEVSIVVPQPVLLGTKYGAVSVLDDQNTSVLPIRVTSP